MDGDSTDGDSTDGAPACPGRGDFHETLYREIVGGIPANAPSTWPCVIEGAEIFGAVQQVELYCRLGEGIDRVVWIRVPAPPEVSLALRTGVAVVLDPGGGDDRHVYFSLRDARAELLAAGFSSLSLGDDERPYLSPFTLKAEVSQCPVFEVDCWDLRPVAGRGETPVPTETSTFVSLGAPEVVDVGERSFALRLGGQETVSVCLDGGASAEAYVELTIVALDPRPTVCRAAGELECDPCRSDADCLSEESCGPDSVCAPA